MIMEEEPITVAERIQDVEFSNGRDENLEPRLKRARCENNDESVSTYGLKRWYLKTAVVTGASSGIGAAISRKLISCGMNVVGIARRESALQKLKENFDQEGLTNGEAKFIPLIGDVCDHEKIDKHLEWIDNNLNGIHVLVNNAGIMQVTPLMDTEDEYWNTIFQTNILAVARMTRQVLKIMKKNHFKYGHIINIGSVAGNNNSYPIPGMVPYFISKKAVSTISEGFRAELSDAQSQVKITTISPGLVKTGIIKTSGLAEKIPEDAPALDRSDVAEAVSFVLSTPENVVISELTIQAITESIHIRLLNSKKASHPAQSLRHPSPKLSLSQQVGDDENGATEDIENAD